VPTVLWIPAANPFLSSRSIIHWTAQPRIQRQFIPRKKPCTAQASFEVLPHTPQNREGKHRGACRDSRQIGGLGKGTLVSRLSHKKTGKLSGLAILLFGSVEKPNTVVLANLTYSTPLARYLSASCLFFV